MNVSNLSDELIVAEACRRFPYLASQLDIALARKQEDEKPRLLTDGEVSLDKLQAACESYIEGLYNHDSSIDFDSDRDEEHFIFEEALKAVYGPGIFNWVNEKLS